jgi:hypothetical protein
VNEMTNFLFEDTIDGGFFFVQCDSLEEAYEIIWEEIACMHSGIVMDCTDVPGWYDYLGDYSDAQAEAMGYDTY